MGKPPHEANVRIAGAPITWGVCEVPGWGLQLDTERVLGDMGRAGIEATELGPPGFLPDDPVRARELLDAHGLELVGGFVTAVLHEPARLAAELAEVEQRAGMLARCGADRLVLAVIDGGDGYDGAEELDARQWAVVLDGIARVQEIAARHDLVTAVHPHAGTMIEGVRDIERVVDGTDVGFCLDSGHFAVGGADAVAFARDHAERIVHVHVKDVRLEIVERVRAGELGYAEAVRNGMYVPLGSGDVDMAAIHGALGAAGYSGWYVLEQDTTLAEDSADPLADAIRSLDAIRAILDGKVPA